MWRRRAVALVPAIAGILLVDCAWMNKSFWFATEQVATDTFRVRQRAYGYDRHPELEWYILSNCAELTLEKGFGAFEVVDWTTEKVREVHSGPDVWINFDYLTLHMSQTRSKRGYDARAFLDGTVKPHDGPRPL